MLLMRLRDREMLEKRQSGAHDRMMRDSRSVVNGKPLTDQHWAHARTHPLGIAGAVGCSRVPAPDVWVCRHAEVGPAAQSSLAL